MTKVVRDKILLIPNAIVLITKIIKEEKPTATAMRSASCTPVYLTIPVCDLVVMNTKEFTSTIKKVAFNTCSQLVAASTTFCWIKMAMNNAVTVAPKSNNKITNFGTMLKLLILNILNLCSFNS